MNTLSRALTAQILNNSETYSTLQKHWRLLINSRRHKLSAAHHLLYLALSGKDWRRGFTPVTNQRKLTNGGFYHWKLFQALALFHSELHEAWLLAPFDGIVTAEILRSIRTLVPLVSAYTYNVEEFAPGRFPFEAYEISEGMTSTIMAAKDYSHVR